MSLEGHIAHGKRSNYIVTSVQNPEFIFNQCLFNRISCATRGFAVLLNNSALITYISGKCKPLKHAAQ